MEYDVFICHASEDKDEFVRPLAEALQAAGLRVWYDEFSLTLGDSLRQSIDQGLANSRYGVVVLSPAFFDKHWPQQELNGLSQREVDGHKVILPVWHEINRDQVAEFSPMLADRLAVMSNQGIPAVVDQVLRAVHGAEGETAAEPTPVYTQEVPVNYQGQINVRPGHMLEITEWFGPDGPGGSGELRIARMADLTDQRGYTSDIANVMMTIVPTKVTIEGRVKGPIEGTGNTTRFRLELTDEQYETFAANRVVNKSPLVG